MREFECDPTRLDALAVPQEPTQAGRLMGLESDRAQAIVRDLTDIEVQPVVRFYTTLYGRVAPHTDAPSFNTASSTQTLIIYLSDCEGGDLFFETGERVRTGRGKVVLFDKSVLHWTDPVSEGTKRCVVCDVEEGAT